jgi:molecular chaperone HscB
MCDACHAPLGVELDFFAALGLPRKLVIDPEDLESAYHERGRQIHPDRFAGGSPAVRDASLRSTALLTRAYRNLRDPVARGLYWLELNGQKLAENNKSVPPEMAELVFEVQEQLTEFREASRDDIQAREMAGTVNERRVEVQNAMNSLREDLESNFRRWDNSADSRGAAHSELTAELKKILSKIAYLRTLLRDIDRELETSAPA